MVLKNMLTEDDNSTWCVVRALGVIGVGFVGMAAIIGAAPFEVGAGVAAVITAIGGGIKLKGQ